MVEVASHPTPAGHHAMIVEVVPGLGDVEAADWDALAGDDNPFVEHAFLRTMERSGSVGPGTGWEPCHLLLRDGGRLVAASPLYQKRNSYGEYIFDWGWAQAAERARIPYYPKLLSAVPFTPATGPRMLLHPDVPNPAEVRRVLAGAGVELARRLGTSSIHWLFVTEAEQETLREAAYLPRLGFQYHWENPARQWRDFDDYLFAMTSKRRKEVRRERAAAHAGGVEIRVVEGKELQPEDWRALERFYRDTVAKMGAHGYLKPAFFKLLPETLAHRVVAVLAFKEGRCIAGALNFRKGDHLYGRYWGTTEPQSGLHFEVCYYALIEWCLGQGISLFEAGAQGEHKLARGFLPKPVRSAHLLFHPGLSSAVGDFLERERGAMGEAIEEIGAEGPFRQT